LFPTNFLHWKWFGNWKTEKEREEWDRSLQSSFSSRLNHKPHTNAHTLIHVRERERGGEREREGAEPEGLSSRDEI
jgi:hypothetical protein